MYKVFLGIGGNIGNKEKNFNAVFHIIGEKLGKIISASSVYESPPWGFHSENVFWNQVFIIETKFEAVELLWRIQEIEDSFGRERSSAGYTSREMDVDILYFEDKFIETETLTIPHPYIQERKFVLVPLVEIAPYRKHPLLRMTSIKMLENCRDKSMIKKIKPPKEIN